MWTIFIIDIGYHTTSHGGKEDNFDNSSERSCDILDRYYNIIINSMKCITSDNKNGGSSREEPYGITERNYKPFNLLDHLTKTIF